MKKRVLGYVLAIMLCLSLISLSVLAAGAAISLNKTVYASGERIVVEVSGITQQMVDDAAFIAIYEAGAAHSEWGEYTYVEVGKSQSELTAPDAHGSYEVRLYRKDHEYTDETFVMKAAFKVGNVSVKNPGKIELEKDSYLANSQIPVKVTGITEQMEKDGAFVSIYKKGAEHDQWGVYTYPKAGDSTIELTAPNLNGDFEMRLYTEDHYYSDATFVMSVPFKLSGATPPKGSAWASGEIEKAAALGMLPDSIKKADLTMPITREEFAETAVRFYEMVTGNDAVPHPSQTFKDTSNPEVLKALNLQITFGVGDGTKFEPKSTLIRQQMAAMITRTLKACYSDIVFDVTGQPDFKDQKSFASYAIEPAKFMAKYGITVGDGKGSFFPNDVCSREQAIAFLIRSFEKIDVIRGGSQDTTPEPEATPSTTPNAMPSPSPSPSPTPTPTPAPTPTPTPADDTSSITDTEKMDETGSAELNDMDQWIVGIWAYSASTGNVGFVEIIEFKEDGTFDKGLGTISGYTHSATGFKGNYKISGDKLILYNQLKSQSRIATSVDRNYWALIVGQDQYKDIPVEDFVYQIGRTADGKLVLDGCEFNRGR